MKKLVIAIVAVIMTMTVSAGAVSLNDVWNNVTETVSECVESAKEAAKDYVIENHDGYFTGKIYQYMMNETAREAREAVHANCDHVYSSVEELIVR